MAYGVSDKEMARSTAEAPRVGRTAGVDLETEPGSIELLATVVRAFERRASSLAKGLSAMGESQGFKLHVDAVSSRAASSFDETSELARYASLLRPFMAPASIVELNGVLDVLASSNLVDAATCDELASELSDADSRLFASVIVDGKALSGRDIYFAYAEGHLFADDAEAKCLLSQFSIAPAWHLIQFLFHGVCRRYAQVVSRFLDAILELERGHPEVVVGVPERVKCIYCLRDDGDFGPEEHVIPESFGVDELVLHGAVCASCNNELSTLDQRLAEFEPIALLRVVNVPLTKKGKFPHASFREFDVQKVKPRELRFRAKSGNSPFEFENLPGGVVRTRMTAHGRKVFEPVELARCLFKLGLGLVAYDAGPEAACGSRYDAAREFIHGAGGFPNHLLMSTEVKPDSKITAAWNDFGEATVVALSCFGIRFAFNIEPTPFDMPDGVAELHLDSWWLGEP